MDAASRFVLSWDVSPGKLNYNAVSLLARARERAGRPPNIFKTDGLKAFGPAFRKVFWSSSSNPRPVRLRESHIRNRRCTNNGHERFNWTLGELLSGARGLQRTDSTLVRASLLHYNFIMPHQGLGGITPARAANITVRGTNTWLTLIQHAALAAAWAENPARGTPESPNPVILPANVPLSLLTMRHPAVPDKDPGTETGKFGITPAFAQEPLDSSGEAAVWSLGKSPHFFCVGGA